MIISEEVVLTQILALLPHGLIFGRIPKSFDTAGSIFLSSSSEHNITYIYAMLFNSYFLSAIWLTHSQFCTISKGTLSLTCS